MVSHLRMVDHAVLDKGFVGAFNDFAESVRLGGEVGKYTLEGDEDEAGDECGKQGGASVNASAEDGAEHDDHDEVNSGGLGHEALLAMRT